MRLASACSTAVRESPFAGTVLDRYSRPCLMSATERVEAGRSAT
jgi:hypothetical protein